MLHLPPRNIPDVHTYICKEKTGLEETLHVDIQTLAYLYMFRKPYNFL